MSTTTPAARPIRLTVWGRTDPGRKRSENQDTFLILEFSEPDGGEGFALDPNGTPLEGVRQRRFELGSRGALLLVADGMGGAAGGAFASQGAADEIRRNLTRSWLAESEPSARAFGAHLTRAVEQANRTLHEAAGERPELEGMGTTATAVGILGNTLCIAQIGDSRAYLVRNGSARQLTRDQSVIQELLDAGALTEEQAARSAQRNVILQALGIGPTVKVDLTYHTLRQGDTVLACSDGLSGQLGPDELARAVAGFSEPVALCEALVEQANARGAPDNVTVVVARAEGSGLEPPRSDDGGGPEAATPGGG